MKRIVWNLMAVSTLILCGCNEEGAEGVPDQVVDDGISVVTVVAETDGTGSMENWTEGDYITAAFTGSETHYIDFRIKSGAEGNTAEFIGEVPDGTYTSVTVIYPGVENGKDGIVIERADTDHIFMSASSKTRVEIKDNTSISLTFRQIMHEIEFAITIADGFDRYAGQDIGTVSIQMTAEDQSGIIRFWETASYNLAKNTLTRLSESDMVVTESEGAFGTASFDCSTQIFPLTRNGITLNLDLYINGTDQYHFTKNLQEENIKLSEGGRSVMNLELCKAALVGGETEEKPIELKASGETILANGSDCITFTVFREDTDITGEAAIFVNGASLQGNIFKTKVPGTYTAYATVGEVISNEVYVTATEVTEGKTIVFADGVSVQSGWYDVNKVGQGNKNGDINMCWAASASNMIQWFQDRYVAAGNTLPSTAVNGADPDGIYELALMKMYHDEWDNSHGGHVQQAIPWYFEGSLQGGEYASAGSQAVPETDGGYWSSIWDDVYQNIYHGYEEILIPGVIEYLNTYTTCYNNYYIWGNGTDHVGTQRLKIFSDLVVECFRYGMAAMSICLNPNFISASHATTLWGYEIDNSTGLLTRVWITDSDDLTTEAKDKILNEYAVSIGDGRSSIKLTGSTRYGSIYVQSLYPFSGYGTGHLN